MIMRLLVLFFLTAFDSWPGTIINKDAELDDLFAFWDFLPTAAAIAGIDESRLPAHDGINMLPAMLNEPEHQQNHTYLYWYVHNIFFNFLLLVIHILV